MGMYTEVFISAMVRNDPAVVEVIRYMGGQTEVEPPLPDHPLFTKPRWTMIFKCCSYYFVPRSTFRFEFDDISKAWVLTSRSDLKNYDGEIEAFFDWITPHLDAGNEMIGYSRYEEDRDPKIYYGGG